MNPIAFRPELPSSAQALLEAFMERMGQCRRNPTLLLSIVRDLSANVVFEYLSEHDRLATRLFFQVLEDLILQGWVFDRRSDEVVAIPPDVAGAKGSDKYEVKKWYRSALTNARNEQLASESTSRFIYDMERPRYYKGRYVGVLNLFLSPKAFASDLKRRLELPETLRETLIREAIKPYVQLVTEDRDSFTNLRLVDIWRYCRQTWSLPHNPQPGRQMLYLVRDAARDYHPIIGIGALGNSVIQITCRDEAIGWTLTSLKREPNPIRFLKVLEEEVRMALEDVYWKDLVPAESLVCPSPEVLEHLESVATAGPILSQYIDGRGRRDNAILADTLSPLYLKKRAQELYRLLQALHVFQMSATTFPDCNDRAKWLLRSRMGQHALGVALRCLKKRHIGTSVMEITTCGAAPPYTTVLGGKLIALLMASPRVISDYRERYKFAPSQIASRMRGSAVTRRSDLVLLGTTSLYSVGSSLYSRLQFPKEFGDMKYRFVGTTRGYGSVHISGRTYQTLQQLLRKHPRLTPESSAFATGVNYKMRSLASGLSFIGAQRLQQHGNPRRVYLIALARNWREYLWGLDDEPEYQFPHDAQRATELLVEFWKNRWFLPRVQNRIFWQVMANSDEKVQVSRFLSPGPDASPLIAVAPSLRRARGEGDYDMQKLSWNTLAQLIRHRGSFAELLDPQELEAVHIPSKLDGHFLELVRQGTRVYLVGNPGDGKTHLIKKYLDKLNALGVFISLDASAQDESELLDELIPVINTNKSAVVAINEGPLRRLLRRLPEAERKQLAYQLDHPYRYGEEDRNNGGALVVNLGIRRVLSSSFIDGAFDLILNRVDYTNAPLGVRGNIEMLKRPRIQERISHLLEYAAHSGAHVTMNQLVGFMSFVVTGGAGVTSQAACVPAYYDLVFDEANPLSPWLSGVDPADIAHPLVDMWIWDGEYPTTVEWLERFQQQAPRLHADSQEAQRAFRQIKRKYYFESRDGLAIFEMLPADHREFNELLSGTVGSVRETAKKKLLEVLSLYFGQTDVTPQDGQIQIWTSLRYEAIAPPTAFISSKAIPADSISLVVPQLHRRIEPLLEFEPSWLRLIVAPRSEDREAIGLDIDLELWLALMRLKRGTPQRFLDPRVGRRLTLFMARLAAEHQSERGLAELKIRDVEVGKVYSISVSLESGKYLL